VFASDGTLLGFNPVSGGRSYVDVLPGLHLRYDPCAGLILRTSVNRSLIRPNYGDLAPYLDINFSQFRARTGNPALKPYEAVNYDWSADYYSDSAGLLSAELFYKTIRNFQVNAESAVTIGNLGQFVESQRINGDEAHIGGVAVGWQSRPWKLPVVVDSVSVAVNYTYSKSASHIPGRPGETFPLPQQARDQCSFTLHLERGKFSSDANLTYHTATLDNIVSAGRDQYLAGVLNLDLGFAYKATPHLSFLAGVRNLTHPPSRSYAGDSSRLNETQFRGVEYNLGVNWKE
jgi:TonB-dependent receptor